MRADCIPLPVSQMNCLTRLPRRRDWPLRARRLAVSESMDQEPFVRAAAIRIEDMNDRLLAAPAFPEGRRVIVASDYQLARRSHIQRLAMATLELGIPRRRLADRSAEVIALYDGDIAWGSGAPFTFSEMQIYEDFLLVEGPGRRTDFSQRWVGDFYRFAVTPPRQLAQGRVIARLRWIDLMWRIENPERAKLIAK